MKAAGLLSGLVWLAVALLAGLCPERAAATAGESPTGLLDPSGIWKWSYPGASNQTVEVQLRLRWEDGRLSGVALGPDKQEIPLQKAEYRDGHLRFEVARRVMGKNFTTVYDGRVNGDRIRGFTSAGTRVQAATRPWEAVRVRGTNAPPSPPVKESEAPAPAPAPPKP